MSRGEAQNFPLAACPKKQCRAMPSAKKIKLFALWKSLSFFATTNLVLFVHNTPLLHRHFTGKKTLRSVLQKEFYTVSTGFSTGTAHRPVEKPSPFRFWKYRFFKELFFPHGLSFFHFYTFFFPHWQKAAFSIFSLCATLLSKNRQTLAALGFCGVFCTCFLDNALLFCHTEHKGKA